MIGAKIWKRNVIPYRHVSIFNIHVLHVCLSILLIGAPFESESFMYVLSVFLLPQIVYILLGVNLVMLDMFALNWKDRSGNI